MRRSHAPVPDPAIPAASELTANGVSEDAGDGAPTTGPCGAMTLDITPRT
jgi:hypothetical protein